MEKNIVNITISGKAMTGKARIHYKIREVFKQLGFDVESDVSVDFNSVEEFESTVKHTVENTLSNMKDRILIKIKEQQI